MLSKKVNDAVNGQIALELYSSYLYVAMGAWLQAEGFLGSAHWMGLQAREEIYHANKFYTYLLERGGEVKLGPIEAPPCKWASPNEVFEKALAHEEKVSGLINNLMTLAKAEKDHAAEIFLQWFVTEQVEEESSLQDIIRKLKLSSGQGAGMFMIDQELGARALSPIVAAALAGTPSTGGTAA